jgi:hypothetical protein
MGCCEVRSLIARATATTGTVVVAPSVSDAFDIAMPKLSAKIAVPPA